MQFPSIQVICENAGLRIDFANCAGGRSAEPDLSTCRQDDTAAASHDTWMINSRLQ